VLVATVDRAFSLRHRVDVIVAENEALSRAEVDSVLKLAGNLSRLVDNARRVENVRAIACRLDCGKQIRTACIAGVHENLREQLLEATAHLIRLINPVLDLCRAESSWLNCVVSLCSPIHT